jgi:hypothetical protein
MTAATRATRSSGGRRCPAETSRRGEARASAAPSTCAAGLLTIRTRARSELVELGAPASDRTGHSQGPTDTCSPRQGNESARRRVHAYLNSSRTEKDGGVNPQDSTTRTLVFGLRWFRLSGPFSRECRRTRPAPRERRFAEPRRLSIDRYRLDTDGPSIPKCTTSR